MGKPIRQRNTGMAGLLSPSNSQNVSNKKYSEGLQWAQGVRFKNGNIDHGYNIGPVTPQLFRAEYLPYPDSRYYIRGGVVSGNASTIPADTALDNNLSTLIKSALQNGNFIGSPSALSSGYTPPSVFPAGYTLAQLQADYASSGYWAADNTTTGVGQLVTGGATNYIHVPQDIQYYRALKWQNGGQTEWGLLGNKTGSFHEDYHRWWWFAGVFGTADRTNLNANTMCRGSQVVSGEHDKADFSGGMSLIKASLSIQPTLFTLKAGYYKPSSLSLFLVGTASMFKSAPQIQNIEFSGSSTDEVSNSCTVDSSSVAPSVPSGHEDTPVFYFDTAYPPTPSLGYWTSDSDITAPTIFSMTPQADSNPPYFKFVGARNKSVRSRRVGIARFFAQGTTTYTPTAGSSDELYVGFTGINPASTGSSGYLGLTVTLNTGTANTFDPYILRLDGPPLWVQQAYQGVFAGTATAEHLIQNEQVSPAAGGANIIKVSSVGTNTGRPAVAMADFCDYATALAGNLYWCAPRGVGHMRYSNEGGSYLPEVVDLVEYGLGRPVSIASSAKMECLIVHTDAGNLVMIEPTVGVVSVMSPFSPSNDSTTYSLVGVSTCEGEVRIVWSYPSSGSLAYVEAMMIEQPAPSIIRTTAFGAGEGGRFRIKKLWLHLQGCTGGTYQVQGDASAQAIPLTSDDIVLGYTGIKEIPVYGKLADRDAGLYVEVQFQASDQFALLAIEAEGEI